MGEDEAIPRQYSSEPWHVSHVAFLHRSADPQFSYSSLLSLTLLLGGLFENLVSV
jgi:hypothetical protein